MGYSKVELANQALDHLGKDSISSLTENSNAARKLNAAFNRSIYSVLSRSHWTFAQKLQSLASVTNDWEERWAYKYDLPNDYIGAVRLVDNIDEPNREGPKFQVLGGALYTDERTAKLRYVYQTVDTLSFPQPFLDACALMLAKNVAMPLTRKVSIRDRLQQEFEYYLGLAIEQDAGQEPTTYIPSDGGYLSSRGSDDTGDYTGGAPDGSIYWT
jgi:hypothetical protein